MMSSLPVHFLSSSSRELPAPIRRYLPSGEIAMFHGFDFQARIGEQLLVSSGVGEPMELGEALAEHIEYRLDEMERAIKDCIDWWEALNDRGWDPQAVLGLLQAPEPEDPLEHLRRTKDDYRAWAKPINTAQMRRWHKASVALAKKTDDLTAFAAFADLEDAFEPIEHQVMDLARQVDASIQYQIDTARGK
jgi:hypothetical protein